MGFAAIHWYNPKKPPDSSTKIRVWSTNTLRPSTLMV